MTVIRFIDCKLHDYILKCVINTVMHNSFKKPGIQLMCKTENLKSNAILFSYFVKGHTSYKIFFITLAENNFCVSLRSCAVLSRHH